jgi:hypothetical protein
LAVSAFFKSQHFVSNAFKGIHNFTSDATCTITVALSNTAGDADTTKATLSQITQISYANLSSRIVTGVSCEQAAGVVHLTGNDLVLTASGNVAPFRYAWLYNDDPVNDPLIGYYDYGMPVVMTAGETFLLDINTDILIAS